MDPVLFVLAVFLVLGSLVALEMKDLLSAVITIGVVGLGLSIIFLLLGAPDIAITQVVVEVIVVTVLILATRGSRVESGEGRRGALVLAVGTLALLFILGFTIHAFGSLPAFGTERIVASTWYLENAPELTGASNVVTAILLDFRAYDTLGEATVILAAVVGVLAVLRRPARRKTEKTPSDVGPTPDGQTPDGQTQDGQTQDGQTPGGSPPTASTPVAKTPESAEVTHG